MTTPDLREAATAVVSQAETDDDFDGQFDDYLVPAESIDALRFALASQPEPLEPPPTLDVERLAAIRDDIALALPAIMGAWYEGQIGNIQAANMALSLVAARLSESDRT